MEVSKARTLEECLSAIQSMNTACDKTFNAKVCENIQRYYIHYCYNKFEKSAICSSDNTFGDNTLNLINKSPSPPSL
jgi:hypothetical protein